ncbi:transglutaminase-like domain-containing protein [Pseudogemmobacter faecipullorum]|uniref:Transglutaminase family protein n=1 Tax=Pseudogemmobacter faecipullorum TaxID=2755041 RepID=A0ABS8CRK2_9RHOB|nr:transglutaminase family protein [Pseudogemmobacter faecipullorum]MCB5412026.1 transglutaminase family protein [Pseudogemmobacter faecipullorum]
MKIRLGYQIELSCDLPTELLALLDPHPEFRPSVLHDSGLEHSRGINPEWHEDSFGNHCLRLSAPTGPLMLKRDLILENSGQPDLWPEDARETPLHDLPGEVLQFLLPSRNCETDLMMETAWERFGAIQPGWGRVRAIFDHVNDHLSFSDEHARNTRTAAQAWAGQKGVCRDFAHLAITFCRCMNIPARYVNGYLPDIGVPIDPAPMDYNAWCEVWIGDQWVTLDARHNQPRIGRIAVARGRDATDIPLLHSFGPHQLRSFSVWCDHYGGDLPLADLSTAPVGEQPRT